MFHKTIAAEFFTTINKSLFSKSFEYLTFKLPKIRYWDNNTLLKKELWNFLWLLDYENQIITCYNGRSALYHALEIIWLEKNDEVIVSGYTCISVPNAVIQAVNKARWKIKYNDIESTNLWLSITWLHNSINDNTKVIIVQHTFGRASKVWEILKIAKEKWIFVIEDCAHSLWTQIHQKKIWTFWDISIFSSWRDKVISSVSGGYLIINNQECLEKSKHLGYKQIMPSKWLTIKNLNYNIFWYLSYLLYDILKIGKIIIHFSRKFWFITEIIEAHEKNCSFSQFNYQLPNSLAGLALHELRNLENITEHRITLAGIYNEKLNSNYFKPIFHIDNSHENNFFRYPILCKSEKVKDELYQYMRKKKVLLWNTWSWKNIVPKWSALEKAQYVPWSCPMAENIAQRILTLPNHWWVNKKQVNRIITLLNKFESNV